MKTNFRRLNGFPSRYKTENQMIILKPITLKTHQNFHQLLTILEVPQANKVE